MVTAHTSCAKEHREEWDRIMADATEKKTVSPDFMIDEDTLQDFPRQLREQGPKCTQCAQPLGQWCIADHKRKDGMWTGPQLSCVVNYIAEHEHNYMLHLDEKCVNAFNDKHPIMISSL